VAHVIGAGLAGLSAAVDLANRGVPVALYEATQQAGGRCRSYFDAALGMEIDNGNHLILSGNQATLAYLDVIGARGGLNAADSASFPFVDLKTKERWTLRANDGPIPWWMLVPSRRVPGVPLGAYLELAKLLRPPMSASIGGTLKCAGPLYERLLEPFLMSALNVEPKEGSAALAASVIRETLAAGGRKYHPLIASDGLSKSFVDPALRFIASHGGEVHFGQRLRAIALADKRAAQLEFADSSVTIAPEDRVIVAAPAQIAGALIPHLSTPNQFRAIVNAHYRVEPPEGVPPIVGVINGLAQWVFAFPGRLSVTISAADHLLDEPREALAARIWRDVAEVAGIAGPMPAWQIVRERRATFAATPEQDARRPEALTAWSNLHLAGDWTQTGLPATIEGAIRSGVKAARLSTPMA
jgi:squalene-associated FAD-dependent desaturase